MTYGNHRSVYYELEYNSTTRNIIHFNHL